MNTIVLSLIGVAAILDVILIFYIGPKTLSSENGSPYIWIPFSFFRKVFAFLTAFYLIHINHGSVYINVLTGFYILGLYDVIKGWGWNLENPWTSYKMDRINIREGHFSPVHPWAFEHLSLYTDTFADRVFYSVAIFFEVIRILGLL
jgi:hypothetical protein